MGLTGVSSVVTLTELLPLREGSDGAVPEEHHDHHGDPEPHLELPLHLSSRPPHHHQGQHAEAVEKGGGHHVHVEQLVDVLQQDEDDPQAGGEEQAGERGEGEPVDVGDDGWEVSLPAGRVHLPPGCEHGGVKGPEGRD